MGKARLSHSSGFTMVELMIALFVAALAIVGYIGGNIAIQRHAEELHERTVALQDANQVAERMRSAARTGNFPANLVAAFPDNGAIAGFNNLTNEQVTVSYVNTTADPLDVTVSVNWQSYARRQSTASLRTYITQR